MKPKIILIAILIIAAYLRYYNLNFGAPFYFNPDERNMAHAIISLNVPTQPRELINCINNSIFKKGASAFCNLNPHFFAYGQFPLYLAFFTNYFYSLFFNFKLSLLNNSGLIAQSISFNTSIFLLRFYSALGSVFTVYIVYKIAKILFEKENYALTASLFTAFTPTLIQSAHFGTTESLLTFFFTSIILTSIYVYKGKVSFKRFILVGGLLSGMAIATKVSGAIFILIPLFTILSLNKPGKIKRIGILILFILVSLIVFILLSPYNLLDFNSFKGSMDYETSVATGKSRVFYTRQFENTIPVIFQIEKVFPYALGYPLFLLGTFGMVISIIKLFKLKKDFILGLILLSFAVYFIPNAVLYAKWTRFVNPIFPLFSIFAVYFLSRLKLNKYIIGLLIILTIIPGINFFRIYLKPDIRVTASEWIYNNMPQNSYILSETANVIDIPLNISSYKNINYKIISFNFYELDKDVVLLDQLAEHLTKANYIFIPSRRVFANHTNDSSMYPINYNYYNLLFGGKLGFEKVAEFKILNDENAEETFSVFDHPVIRIFIKTKEYNKQDYINLLTSPNIF